MADQSSVSDKVNVENRDDHMKMNSLDSRLQLLEKRLLGSTSVSEDVEDSCNNMSKPIIIKALGVDDKFQNSNNADSPNDNSEVGCDSKEVSTSETVDTNDQEMEESEPSDSKSIDVSESNDVPEKTDASDSTSDSKELNVTKSIEDCEMVVSENVSDSKENPSKLEPSTVKDDDTEQNRQTNLKEDCKDTESPQLIEPCEDDKNLNDIKSEEELEDETSESQNDCDQDNSVEERIPTPEKISSLNVASECQKSEDTSIEESSNPSTDDKSPKREASKLIDGADVIKSEVKEVEALKKGKGIDAIACMLRKQQVEDKSTKSGTSESPAEANQVKSNVPDNKDVIEKSTSDSEVKSPSTRGSSKRIKMCAECNETKTCKYQIMMPGPNKLTQTHLCDDKCYTAFREKQRKQKQASKKVVESSKDYCCVCKKDMKNISNFLPKVGQNYLNLCSEYCFLKYRQMEGPKRLCSQCKKDINEETKCLAWETMEFCSEDCLSDYQNYLGSHCACCNNSVQNSSLGKFCVRFGSDIKQFCSNTCLEEFKKGLKVCTFCQKDISNGIEGFLAPVGDKGQFKDFCTQQCMEKYNTMNNPSSVTPKMNRCIMCNKVKPIKIEVEFKADEGLQQLCNEYCYEAYKFAHKIKQHKCNHCHKLFESSDKDSQSENTIQIEGIGKRFCSKMCLNIYVLSNRHIVPCSWCKVKKYNFDMIKKMDVSNEVQLFCSLNCLSLFRVSRNAVSSRTIKCDACHKTSPAQYHLTMSDATVRNFCCYGCVTNFQSLYPNMNFHKVSVSTVNNKKSPLIASQQKSQSSASPLISSVMSLKQSPSQRMQNLTPISASRPTVANLLNAKTNNSNQPSQTILNSSQQTGSQHTLHQLIVKPPQPKLLKNKGTLCKPFSVTKGVSCRPHPCYKSTQTETTVNIESGNSNGKVIPIPIPVFIPVPTHMFSMPAPTPVPFPVPIPVPIFIPTLANSTEELVKTLKEIKEKVPQDPYEADLIMMAEMVADRDKDSTVDADKSELLTSKEEQLTNNDMSIDKNVELIGVENILQASIPSDNPVHGSTNLDSTSDRSKQLVQKRKADDELDNSSNPNKKPKVSDEFNGKINAADYTKKLQYKLGVSSWKNWVLKKNKQLENVQSNRKLKLFKTDILQLSADELNYSLCLFVKEVRNASGESYSADSIYYLCLGIQQYLFLSNRIDNIFTDANFEKFTECLHEILTSYEGSLTTMNKFVPRIKSDILWESRQLGAHSPHVLLNTLLYFNTKYFGLRTVEEHMKMSFSLVIKHWKKTNKGNPVCLKYYSPASPIHVKGPKRKKEYLEQVENVDNPLQCPVKLYEFYLLKCPEVIKSRNDVYYLQPERSCIPDSPVWYSVQPLSKDQLTKMLQRVKMIIGTFDS